MSNAQTKLCEVLLEEYFGPGVSQVYSYLYMNIYIIKQFTKYSPLVRLDHVRNAFKPLPFSLLLLFCSRRWSA